MRLRLAARLCRRTFSRGLLQQCGVGNYCEMAPGTSSARVHIKVWMRGFDERVKFRRAAGLQDNDRSDVIASHL